MRNIIEREISTVLAVIVVFAALLLTIILTAPINVLSGYSITTQDSTYTTGEQLTINTQSTKVRKSSGIAHRTIECDAGENKIVDYAVNNSPALGSTGFHTNSYNIVIPDSVANLPANCRVVTAIRYDVFRIGNIVLRHVTENAVSNDFTVEAK